MVAPDCFANGFHEGLAKWIRKPSDEHTEDFTCYLFPLWKKGEKHTWLQRANPHPLALRQEKNK